MDCRIRRTPIDADAVAESSDRDDHERWFGDTIPERIRRMAYICDYDPSDQTATVAVSEYE